MRSLLRSGRAQSVSGPSGGNSTSTGGAGAEESSSTAPSSGRRESSSVVTPSASARSATQNGGTAPIAIPSRPGMPVRSLSASAPSTSVLPGYAPSNADVPIPSYDAVLSESADRLRDLRRNAPALATENYRIPGSGSGAGGGGGGRGGAGGDYFSLTATRLRRLGGVAESAIETDDSEEDDPLVPRIRREPPSLNLRPLRRNTFTGTTSEADAEGSVRLPRSGEAAGGAGREGWGGRDGPLTPPTEVSPGVEAAAAAAAADVPPLALPDGAEGGAIQEISTSTAEPTVGDGNTTSGASAPGESDGAAQPTESQPAEPAHEVPMVEANRNALSLSGTTPSGLVPATIDLPAPPPNALPAYTAHLGANELRLISTVHMDETHPAQAFFTALAHGHVSASPTPPTDPQAEQPSEYSTGGKRMKVTIRKGGVRMNQNHTGPLYLKVGRGGKIEGRIEVGKVEYAMGVEVAIIGLVNTSYYVRGQYTLIDTLPLVRRQVTLYPLQPGEAVVPIDHNPESVMDTRPADGSAPSSTATAAASGSTSAAGPSSSTTSGGPSVSFAPAPSTGAPSTSAGRGTPALAQPTISTDSASAAPAPAASTSTSTSTSTATPSTSTATATATATAPPTSPLTLTRTLSRPSFLKSKSAKKVKPPPVPGYNPKIMTKDGTLYLTQGQTFDFELTMPNQHYRDSNVELPPSCQIYQVGMQAGVEYVLRVKMARKGWRLNESVTLPIVYEPRAYITPRRLRALTVEDHMNPGWRTIRLHGGKPSSKANPSGPPPEGPGVECTLLMPSPPILYIPHGQAPPAIPFHLHFHSPLTLPLSQFSDPRESNFVIRLMRVATLRIGAEKEIRRMEIPSIVEIWQEGGPRVRLGDEGGVHGNGVSLTVVNDGPAADPAAAAAAAAVASAPATSGAAGSTEGMTTGMNASTETTSGTEATTTAPSDSTHGHGTRDTLSPFDDSAIAEGDETSDAASSIRASSTNLQHEAAAVGPTSTGTADETASPVTISAASTHTSRAATGLSSPLSVNTALPPAGSVRSPASPSITLTTSPTTTSPDTTTSTTTAGAAATPPASTPGRRRLSFLRRRSSSSEPTSSLSRVLSNAPAAGISSISETSAAPASSGATTSASGTANASASVATAAAAAGSAAAGSDGGAPIAGPSSPPRPTLFTPLAAGSTDVHLLGELTVPPKITGTDVLRRMIQSFNTPDIGITYVLEVGIQPKKGAVKENFEHVWGGGIVEMILGAKDLVPAEEVAAEVTANGGVSAGVGASGSTAA